MNEVLNLLFTQDFLIRALIVGVLISLCSALLGVSLVLKRFSMIGDGLSHVSFGAMAIACAVNIAPLYFALPIVIVAAFLLLKISEKGKIKGDAAIALISTGALAVGIMATSMTTGMNIDIYNYMFGSILTMSDSDVAVVSVLAVVVIVLFVIFYNEIFAVTFDESFAKATGTKTSLYNMLIAGLTAVTIVIGMRMMGALLISSLIIFPTVTSMRLAKSFRRVIISGAFLSVVCFIFGLFLSVKYEAPTGASVVCVNIFAFLMFTAIRFLKSGKFKYKNIFVALFITVCIALFTMITVLPHSNDTVTKNKTSVITTTFAAYDFSKNILGDMGEAEMLLSPGEESHTFEPTPSDIMKIKECDVFVYGGGESEQWVEKILSSVESDVLTVKMMDVVELYEEKHIEGMQMDDEHGHGDHSHEAAEYDEHVWTSVKNAVKITEEICRKVVIADQSNAEYYKKNTSDYIGELNKLDSDFSDMVAGAKSRHIVVGDRFPMRYLLEDYGITYSAAFPGCSAQVEANPVTIAFLNDKINEEDIPVVFKVDLSTGTVASSISESTGAEIRTLYSCHVISDEDFKNNESYISLMRRNLDSLTYALN